MVRLVTRVYAVLVAGLAVAGLLVTDGHLFQVLNVDTALDILRIGLAGLLIYAGFISRSWIVARNALFATGVIYVGLAIAGLLSSDIGGLLPNGLTGFDIAFHAITGIAAIGVAVLYSNDDE